MKVAWVKGQLKRLMFEFRIPGISEIFSIPFFMYCQATIVTFTSGEQIILKNLSSVGQFSKWLFGLL